jgi:hypothetical protein
VIASARHANEMSRSPSSAPARSVIAQRKDHSHLVVSDISLPKRLVGEEENNIVAYAAQLNKVFPSEKCSQRKLTQFPDIAELETT